MVPDLLSDKESLLLYIRRQLGEFPLDFSDKWHTIQTENDIGHKERTAGVLLLLEERPVPQRSVSGGHELVLQLIKRSGRVSQGGDISCPGGMLNPVLDRGLAWLTQKDVIPAFDGLSRDYARKRSEDNYRLINLFLATAMRESWEEIRLSPFNIDFLGPLPTYSLSLFRRTIFPLVAHVKKPWVGKMNPEVDKLIEIPLKQFFEVHHYARFIIESPSTIPAQEDEPPFFPCFVHDDAEGHQEILWGATFKIIMTFLHIVFQFQLPYIPATHQFRRVLTSDYLTGRPAASRAT